MPNRIIKETILTSENLNSLSANAEILFYRLMVACDDFGIYYAAPSLIRSKCFPWRIDKIKDKDIEEWIKELCKAELIFIYTYSDKKYLKFTKWENHQSVRATKSKFVTPTTEGVILQTIESNCFQLSAIVPVFVFDNSIRNSNSNRESVDKSPLEIALNNFYEMRKSIKSAMTDNAKNLMLTKLNKLSQDPLIQIKILEESTMNCWKGIFELKGEDNGNTFGKKIGGDNKKYSEKFAGMDETREF